MDEYRRGWKDMNLPYNVSPRALFGEEANGKECNHLVIKNKVQSYCVNESTYRGPVTKTDMKDVSMGSTTSGGQQVQLPQSRPRSMSRTCLRTLGNIRSGNKALMIHLWIAHNKDRGWGYGADPLELVEEGVLVLIKPPWPLSGYGNIGLCSLHKSPCYTRHTVDPIQRYQTVLTGVEGGPRWSGRLRVWQELVGWLTRKLGRAADGHKVEGSQSVVRGLVVQYNTDHDGLRG
ncbi:hypothetical protein V8F33_003310 [Rhypophila sp. PSN 637]